MSDDKPETVTWLEEFFGDGVHRFNLCNPGLAEAIELEEKLGEGPMVTFNRFYRGAWRVDDARHVIRLGLVGGGMEPAKAHKLVERYFEKSPIAEHVGLAMSIMATALYGRDPDKPALAEPEPEPEVPADG